MWKVPSPYKTLLLPNCLIVWSVENKRILSPVSVVVSLKRNWSPVADFCHSSGMCSSDSEAGSAGKCFMLSKYRRLRHFNQARPVACQ